MTKTYSPDELAELAEHKVKNVKKFIKKYCCHTAGGAKWRGKPFKLINWQHDLINRAFGTLKPDGLRQYRTIYVEIPKKNGKTEFAAALALYGLCADGEYGAEVYAAAGDRFQAGHVYKAAISMVQQRGLKKELKPIMSQKRLVYHQTNSYFQVLSNEAFTKHGMNPSIIIFDELHAQPNRELYDVLVEGTDRAREQQLIIIITTAGVYDKESIGFQIHDYAMQVQAGEIEDSTFLPIIYAIDEDEDPDDSEVWKKVNPALGEIFEFNKLEEHYQQSRHDPVRWNHFLRFTLNKWVGQVKRFIPMMHWDACGKKVYPHKLKGKPCFAGLDLGSTDDLTAFVLIFPPVDKKRKTYDIIPHFYVPEDTVVTRSKSEQEKIKKWIQQGYITATPGNVRDYSFIRKDIIEASKLYDIRELAFDRWGASEIVQDIQENIGIELVGHGQGFADMSAPTKELLVMVLGHKLAHGGHPVLRWNADNLSCRQDAAENYKPDKEKAKERIDGVVALIMALGRCLANPDIRSVYEDRGILFL